MINKLLSNSNCGGRSASRAGDGSPEAVKKLIDTNPKLKARFPDGQIERVLMAVAEQCRLTEISQRPRQYAAICGTGELACGLIWFRNRQRFVVPPYAGLDWEWAGWHGHLDCWFCGGMVSSFRRQTAGGSAAHRLFRDAPEKRRWVGMIAGMAVGMIVAAVIGGLLEMNMP